MHTNVRNQFISTILASFFVTIFAADVIAQAGAGENGNDQIDYAAIQTGME